MEFWQRILTAYNESSNLVSLTLNIMSLTLNIIVVTIALFPGLPCLQLFDRLQFFILQVIKHWRRNEAMSLHTVCSVNWAIHQTSKLTPIWLQVVVNDTSVMKVQHAYTSINKWQHIKCITWWLSIMLQDYIWPWLFLEFIHVGLLAQDNTMCGSP